MIKNLKEIAKNAKKEEKEEIARKYNSEDIYYLITSRCIIEAEKGKTEIVYIDTIKGLENTYSVDKFLKYVTKDFSTRLKEEYGIKFEEVKPNNPISKDFKFIKFYW